MLFTPNIVFLFVCGLVDHSLANDSFVPETNKKYCAIKCGTVNHTMCSSHIPIHGPPVECIDFRGGLTEQEKNILLEGHNEWRRQVAVGETPNQPLATNMMKLVWDDEIAQIAQRWADQCRNNENDLCRLTLAREEAGQNLQLITANSRVDAMKTILAKWFGQYENFDTSLVDKYDKSGDSAGSYCQMVWANTRKVGCGFAAQEKDLDNQYKMVCNYVPTGLVNGLEVYHKGIPCTKCPEGTFCSFSVPGLCTNNKSDHDQDSAHLSQSHLIILPCLFLSLRLFLNLESRSV